MNTRTNRETVQTVLRDVAIRCQKNRALILTESDLKCQVYLQLNLQPEFSGFQNTFDYGILGSSIHTETKFFDQHGLLRQAPDLVITDANRLSITRRIDGSPLPSKGFHFDGSAILIELKFLKRDKHPTKNDLQKIEQDILKGETLNRRGDINFHLFVAVFDRFRHADTAVNELFLKHQKQNNLTPMYFAGGDSFR